MGADECFYCLATPWTYRVEDVDKDPPLPKTSRSSASFGLRVCEGWWGNREEEEDEGDEDKELLSLMNLFLICSMGVSSVIMETN